MKELSIEEKAKRYDEAIERAKEFVSKDNVEVAEYIFPELAKPEDERIRKNLITCISTLKHPLFSEKERKEFLAWLEKQGEQKSTYTKEYDFHGIKFIPKFAKGDIIKDKKRGEISTIKDFSYDTGLYTHTYGQFPITIQDNYEIIEQKPAETEKGAKENFREIPNSAWSEEDESLRLRTIGALETCKIGSPTKCVDEQAVKALQEKPVSEELEEAADEYTNAHYQIFNEYHYEFGDIVDDIVNDKEDVNLAFKAGAEWQLNKIRKKYGKD